MLFLAVFVVEFIFLFLLSRSLTRSLPRFLSIHVLSFIFLPGVIIHELSHLLVAAVMFVPVGEIEFTPKETKSGLKLGSVEIGRTDPIRRMIIGFAPVFVGLSLILGIIYYLISFSSFWGVPLSGTTPESVFGRFWAESSALTNQNDGLFQWIAISVSIGLFYLLFAISNTMFSSPKDMEGTAALLLTFLIIFVALYFLGVRIPLTWFSFLLSEKILDFFRIADIFLLLPLGIDAIAIGIARKIGK